MGGFPGRYLLPAVLGRLCGAVQPSAGDGGGELGGESAFARLAQPGVVRASAFAARSLSSRLRLVAPSTTNEETFQDSTHNRCRSGFLMRSKSLCELGSPLGAEEISALEGASAFWQQRESEACWVCCYQIHVSSPKALVQQDE